MKTAAGSLTRRRWEQAEPLEGSTMKNLAGPDAGATPAGDRQADRASSEEGSGGGFRRIDQRG
jgi:hypothetical protein